MASSTIKQTIPQVEEGVLSFANNSSFCTGSTIASRKYGNIVNFRLELSGTVSQLSAGTKVNCGSLTGSIPQITNYIPLNRKDGGNAVGWLILPTTGGTSCNIEPLATIPSGVVLVACGTYICN